MNDFTDFFPKQLPPGLPPERKFTRGIDLVLGTQMVSIRPDWMNQFEEDELAKQLDEYIYLDESRIMSEFTF